MSDQTTVNYSNDDAARCINDIIQQKRRRDSENAVLANLYKAAKSAGHDIDAIKRVLRNRKKDQGEMIRTYQNEIRYSGLLRMPITPESLFEGMDFSVTEKTQRGIDLWDAQGAGYTAGRAGAKVEDCPYPAGSEAFVSWQEFREQGAAAVARELGPNAQVAAARRGRPRRRQADLPMEAPKLHVVRGGGRKKKAAASSSAPRRAGRRTTRMARQPVTEDGTPAY